MSDWVPLLQGGSKDLERARNVLSESGVAAELVREPGAKANA